MDLKSNKDLAGKRAASLDNVAENPVEEKKRRKCLEQGTSEDAFPLLQGLEISHLLRLSDDVLLQIMSYLKLIDILSLAKYTQQNNFFDGIY